MSVDTGTAKGITDDGGVEVWDPYAPGDVEHAVTMGRSDAQRERLDAMLDDAVTVFGSLGYHRASVRAVAKQSGKAASALYYYVRSKEQALFLIACRGYWRLMANMAPVLAQPGDSEQRLRAVIAAHIDHQVRFAGEFMVLFRDLDALGGAARHYVDGLREQYADMVRSAVQDYAASHGISTGDKADPGGYWRRATYYLFGMIHWAIFSRSRYEKDPWHALDEARFAQEVSDLFIGGLARGVDGDGRGSVGIPKPA